MTPPVSRRVKLEGLFVDLAAIAIQHPWSATGGFFEPGLGFRAYFLADDLRLRGFGL
jgi:hypothetical protein